MGKESGDSVEKAVNSKEAGKHGIHDLYLDRVDFTIIKRYCCRCCYCFSVLLFLGVVWILVVCLVCVLRV